MADILQPSNNLAEDDDLTIEQASGGLQYPLSDQSAIPNWITFSRKVYSKDAMLANAKLLDAQNSRTIVLPLPAQLVKSSSAEWDMDNLGAWGNQIRSGVSAVDQIIKKAVASGSQAGAWESVSQSLEMGWNNSGDIAKNAATAFAVDAALNNDTFRKAGVATGLARNPFKATLFNSMNFRSFNFQYKFMAKNLNEALVIRDIIKEFQVGMSPSFEEALSNNIFKYPDVFKIRFTDDSFLFKIAPCVLTNITVDYHAEGSPIWFRASNGTRVPGSVSLQMDFRETAILSREEYEKEGY